MVTVTSRILSVVMRPVMRWRTAVRVRMPGAELWKQEGHMVREGWGKGGSGGRGSWLTCRRCRTPARTGGRSEG